MYALAKPQGTNELLERRPREPHGPTVVRDGRGQTRLLPGTAPQTLKTLGDAAARAHRHQLRRPAGQIGIAPRGLTRGEPRVDQRRRQPHPDTS
jgi:hypothetical protein